MNLKNPNRNDPQKAEITKPTWEKIFHATPEPLETRTRTLRPAQMALATKSQLKNTSRSTTANEFSKRSTVTLRSPLQSYIRLGTPVDKAATAPSKQTTPTKPNSGDAFATPQAFAHQCEAKLFQTPPPKSTSKDPILPTDGLAALEMLIPLLQEPYNRALKAAEDKATINVNTLTCIGQLLNVISKQINQPISDTTSAPILSALKHI